MLVGWSVDHPMNKVTHLTLILSTPSGMAAGKISMEVAVFTKVVYGDIVSTSGADECNQLETVREFASLQLMEGLDTWFRVSLNVGLLI